MSSNLKVSLVIFLLLSFLIKIEAQQKKEVFSFPKKVSIFWTPTAMLYPRLNGVLMGVEYRWKPNLAFQQQLGFSSIKITENRNSPNILPLERRRIGYRWISELRKYDDPFGANTDNFYYGLQLLSWHYKETGEFRFCRKDCQYQQLMNYRLYHTAVGLAVSKGFVKRVGKNWTIECGGSIGFLIRINRTNLPEDADYASEPNLFNAREPNPNDTINVRESILVFFKVAYMF